jgi:hypothetical protein
MGGTYHGTNLVCTKFDSVGGERKEWSPKGVEWYEAVHKEIVESRQEGPTAAITRRMAQKGGNTDNEHARDTNTGQLSNGNYR